MDQLDLGVEIAAALLAAVKKGCTITVSIKPPADGDAGATRPQKTVRRAVEWLLSYLSTDKPTPSNQVFEEGLAVGLTKDAISEAKRKLGVKHVILWDGNTKYYGWQLPTGPTDGEGR